VFRRFTGLLLGRPLRRGHIGALRFHRRKGFHFRQGIGSRRIQLGGGRESNPRGSRGKAFSPGDEGPAPRSRPAAGGEDCRSHLRAVLDRSWPSPASPSRGSNDGEGPRSDGGWQPPPRSDDLGQVRRHSVGFHVGALLAPPFFQSETRFLSSCPTLNHELFRPRETIVGNHRGAGSDHGEDHHRKAQRPIRLEPRRIASKALGRRVSELRGALNGVTRLSLGMLEPTPR
jgi:hypothetical protein